MAGMQKRLLRVNGVMPANLTITWYLFRGVSLFTLGKLFDARQPRLCGPLDIILSANSAATALLQWNYGYRLGKGAIILTTRSFVRTKLESPYLLACFFMRVQVHVVSFLKNTLV